MRPGPTPVGAGRREGAGEGGPDEVKAHSQQVLITRKVRDVILMTQNVNCDGIVTRTRERTRTKVEGRGQHGYTKTGVDVCS